MITKNVVRCWTLLVALVALVTGAVSPAAPAAAQTAALPAFPGAEGYGAISKGGRGGKVILVKNLNDSGPDSLREALEASGPRIIVFRVGGIIDLKSRLEVEDPFVTIAAQSAPGDGITIRNFPMSLRTNDIILRGLRVRGGTEQTEDADADGFKLTTLETEGNVENIIIDHSSISWTGDEQLSFYNTDKIIHEDGSETHNKNGTLRNISVQWSIVSEALRDEIPDRMTGYAALICDYVENISFHHNLMAHHTDRNPAINADVKAEVINNVVYNWYSRGAVISGFGHGVKKPSFVNMIGNYYKKGNDTYKTTPNDRGIELEADFAGDEGSSGPDDTASRFYMRGNVGPGRLEDTGDEWDVVNDELGEAVANDNYRATARVNQKPAFPVTEHSATDAYTMVLENAGALSPRRDEVDERVVAEVREGKGKNISHVSEVGGYPDYNDPMNNKPPTDSDSDGMPDDWETSHGLDPKARNDAGGKNVTAPSGYMWVEEYLNSLLPSTAETFQESSAAGWKPIGGRWQITDDYKYGQSNTSGITYSTMGSQYWDNYAVEAKIKPMVFGVGGNAALYARFRDTNNFYRLHIGAGRDKNIELRRRYKGVDTILKQGSLPVHGGNTYQVRLELSGANIRAYLDGKLFADVSDRTFSEGRIGIGTYNSSTRFDDIAISSNVSRLNARYENNADGWTASGGTWSVNERQYQQTQGSGSNYAAAGDASWRNYTVEATATPRSVAVNGYVAVYARLVDAKNNYQLTVAPGSTNNLSIRKRLSDKVTVLDQASLNISVNQAYRLKLVASGTRLLGYVDGRLVLEANDSTAPIAAGRVALGTVDATAAFDNIVVK